MIENYCPLFWGKIKVPGTLYANNNGFNTEHNVFKAKIGITHFNEHHPNMVFSENFGGKDYDYLVMGNKEQLLKWADSLIKYN